MCCCTRGAPSTSSSRPNPSAHTAPTSPCTTTATRRRTRWSRRPTGSTRPRRRRSSTCCSSAACARSRAASTCPRSILDSYLLRAMALSGWAPGLADCARCGAPGPHDTFVAQLGGMICRNCAPVGAARVDVRHRRAARVAHGGGVGRRRRRIRPDPRLGIRSHRRVCAVASRARHPLARARRGRRREPEALHPSRRGAVSPRRLDRPLSARRSPGARFPRMSPS